MIGEDNAKDRLKLELLKMDIELRRKQVAWETPRNIAIVVGAAIALSAALAGWLGYQTGRNPSPSPVIINLPAQGK